ncbi:DUF2993 domain-containing protein [Cellulomonas sp. WB94]|uniref:LmeA family phospholipid-binding protein n=1 Tax=Cellulomonas sp. WB94 TaxID=2173174 RepID=UPI0011B25E9D|nr:DUF2993 domain-containing protein [Cellulomonas sp. WB94]
MRARRVVVGVVVLGVLAVGVVVGDRAAASAAERRVVTEIEARMHVTGTPQVDVGGFPFLTQLVARSIDRTTVHVDAVTFDGVEVTDVDLDLHGVSVATPVVADRLVVTGTLSPATLTRLAADSSGLAIELGVDGGTLTASMTFLGVPVVALLAPRVEAGVIRVDVTTVRLGSLDVAVDDLPGALADGLRGLQIPVDGLPDGVQLTAVAVVPGGARITAVGTHVPLTSLR